MLERAAQLEEVNFDINDTSLVEIEQFDTWHKFYTRRAVSQKHPLYLVLKLFKSLHSNPEQQKTLSLETIDQVCDLTLQKLKNNGSKWILKNDVLDYWFQDWRFIHGHLCDVVLLLESPLKEALSDLIIRTGFAIEKNVDPRSRQREFKSLIGTTVSDLLVSLGKLYFKAGQFHLSEAYCLKHLAYLETLSRDDLDDLMTQKFLAKTLLAHIYLKSGNSQVAVEFFSTTYNTLSRHNNSEFKYAMSNFWGLYRDTLEHFYKNEDLLKILDVYRSFFKDYTLVGDIKGLKAEILEKMQKDIKFIHLIFAQAKLKYEKELNEKVKNSLLLKDRVSQFKFDFDKNNLTLGFKDSDLNLFLNQAFKAKGIKYSPFLDNQFLVSINQCSIKQLERVCQYALSLQKEHLDRQAQREQEKTSEMMFTSPVNNQSESVSQTNVFSVPVISQPEISSPLTVQTNVARKNKNKNKKNQQQKHQQQKQQQQKQQQKKQQQQQKQSANNLTPLRPPLSTTEVPKIRYQWPSGLIYDSSEKNHGQVKMLTNDFLPDGIWFGYIPDWMNWDKIDKNYIEEFKGRLTTGSISQGCIREITKQLRTWKQNFSTKHPYKFKIVVKNHDYRIYGWIEEVLNDEEGKTHFLVCFGFLGSHKLKYLPDPEKVKRDSLTAQITVVKAEQVDPPGVMRDQLIVSLTGIIYNESFIPFAMRKVLQGLLNSLYESAYDSAKIFGGEGLTFEQATILFLSLENMCAQIMELGKMELGSSKEQLGILKNMADLLSALNEQKIYQPIITPLFKVIKHIESDYFANKLQAGQPLQEVISKESPNGMMLTQLKKRISEKTEKITGGVGKIEKTVMNQEQVNETQIAASIQRQPSPRKDVTEIINSGVGEPKLKF